MQQQQYFFSFNFLIFSSPEKPDKKHFFVLLSIYPGRIYPIMNLISPTGILTLHIYDSENI